MAASIEQQHGTQSVPSSPWWHGAVIYEIYPRSFQDSNGDGVGDLNGITERLDYLKNLGVDAIWLTPIYPSPQADFGYDISDFTAIDPLYGTMADFDRLMAEAKRRGIRVMMDLVLNHTSDEHPWFKESAASRTSLKRDWYIWRDGRPRADGSMGPPNNWLNRIEQDAWRYDPGTRQFYYHFFDPKQPDLNWRNPAVQRAMFGAARFWLKKGVAGFRIDAFNTIFEREDLADTPPHSGLDEYGEPGMSQPYQRNQPEVHRVLSGLRRVSDAFGADRLLVGEIYTRNIAELKTWYGTQADPELQLPMNTNVGFLNRLDAAAFRKLLTETELELADKVPLYVFDNHDRPRSWDRYGDGSHNLQIAKIIAAILLGTRSTSLIYQGQEIGMVTTTPNRKEEVRDPRGIAGWPREKGRDGSRTPMQWDGSRNAGFSEAARPWLPIPGSYLVTNVSAERSDPDSLLAWYRRLISLRRNNPVFRNGRNVMFDHDAQNALVWFREDRIGRTRSGPILVACNMSERPIVLDLRPDLADLGVADAKLKPLMNSAGATPSANPGTIALPPYATLVAELVPTAATASRGRD